MSIYAYFCCHDCRQTLFLGKALLLKDESVPFAFHIGNTSIEHWHSPEKSKLLWRFVAAHTGHRIEVLLEQNLTEEIATYPEIGGDKIGDIAVADFLAHPSGYYSD